MIKFVQSNSYSNWGPSLVNPLTFQTAILNNWGGNIQNVLCPFFSNVTSNSICFSFSICIRININIQSMKVKTSFDWILMFIHMQMAKEKQNLLPVTFKKMDKARFECYLLKYSAPRFINLSMYCCLYEICSTIISYTFSNFTSEIAFTRMIPTWSQKLPGTVRF